jgi:hypothetical protein
MSVALVENKPEIRARASDWDLVLHLVASHHGYCRPFAPPILDFRPVDVTALWQGVRLAASSGHTLVRIDSGVSERFWKLVRKYGWWGLAWLEAIVRLPIIAKANTRRIMPDAAGIVLQGLDGGTPLGFMAGLGVQRVLKDARLSWIFLDAEWFRSAKGDQSSGNAIGCYPGGARRRRSWVPSLLGRREG